MITEQTYSAEIEVPLNPFPGLRPFEFNESNLYFGRDGQSERMLSKLAARRFVAVVGTSGSGKSSLVRAGLLPALFGGFMTSAGSNWRVALMRPGSDPLGNLARALNEPGVFGSDVEENAALQTVITEATLRRGSRGLIEAVRHTRMPANENLLVIVDQFEELFRFARVAEGDRYQNEAAAFVKLLLEAVGQREIPIYVVLTLRSDYLGDCALFWGLPEAVNEGQFLIPRLTREQRREAITGPVAVCGGDIAPRLVNRLLNDVGDDQDQLPILQHALMRAWDCWRDDHAEGEPIDLRHYEAIGTMAEALSRHADEAFKELPDERSRHLAERMFKGLTEKGADNREVRRPLELRDICALVEAPEEEVVAVIEPFRREGRSFLMPPAAAPLTSESVIDISHESLIRCWGRLRQWVEEETRSARIYRRLAESAALYRSGEAQLLLDPELQLALNWREENQPNEAWARRYHPEFDSAMDFLERSRKVRDREAQEKELARRRELRRTRLVAFVFLILFLFSILATAVALAARREAVQKTEQLERQTRVAEAERANAEQQRRIAEEQRTIAETQKEQAEKNFLEAESARQATLVQKQRAEEQSRIAHANELKAVRAGAEAERQRLLAIRQEKAAHEAERQATSEAERANHLLYAADINLAQQEFNSGKITRAQELLDTFAPRADAPGQGALRGYEWYYLWHRYHNERETLEDHGAEVTAVATSPDGKVFATASVDGTVIAWDTFSRRELAKPNWGAHPLTRAYALAFSPDGRRLAIAEEDDTVRLWDMAEPQKEPALLRGGGSARLYSVAFSPDGRRLAAGDGDNNLLLWGLSGQTGAPRVLKGHAGPVRAVAYSPDGRTLATAGNDYTVRLWDMSAPEPRPKTMGQFDGPVVALSFSPDGAMLASGNDDGAVALWNLRAPARSPALLKGHGKGTMVNTVAFSPDGRTLASGGEDGAVLLWDTTDTGGKPFKLGEQKEGVTSIAFSQDGRLLVSGGSNQKVKLWDIGSHNGPTTLRGNSASVPCVAYSPDGRRLATGNEVGGVKIWDARSRRELAGFKAHEGEVWAIAYSPDGRRLATAGHDATIKLWDADAPGRDPVVLGTGQTKDVYTLAFSPDGRWLASGGGDNRIRVWDLGAPGAGPRTLEEHKGAVTSVAFSPDGRTLVSGSFDGTVKLWDLSAPRPQSSTLGEQKAPIWAVAFSPDGRKVAAGGDDQEPVTVRVWDVATRRNVGVLKWHSKAVKSIAFSRDGRSIATGSLDGTVMLWSATSFQPLATLEQGAGVLSVAFSPDSRTLASSSFAWDVKLWYAATDDEVAAKQR